MMTNHLKMLRTLKKKLRNLPSLGIAKKASKPILQNSMRNLTHTED
jgi:hypothetical protein